MPLIYKTLFEVKLMHEFYCTNSDGETVFDFPLQKDRINFLFNQFADDKESITSDIEYKFPDELESIYNSYNLKLLSSWSGFKVAVRVNQHILPDNSLVFQPIASLPDDFNIYVQLLKRNNLLDSYTNSAITNSVPFIYFFSNENILNPKLFPSLTNTISPFDTGKIYDQGELASFGVNDIREFYKDDLGDQWEPVTGNGFANENDRLLLPLKFYYSFNSADNINNADFILKDNTGNIITSISISSADPVQKTLLDFSDSVNPLFIPGTFLFPDIIYSLEVSGNNGYSKNYKVIFSDALYTKTCWGLVNMKPAATNSSFNLFASDGFLIKRKSPLGIWDDAPVFEIPIKSRFTFWRYINDKGKELDLISLLADYLFKEDKILLSKRPRAISKSYFLLEKEASTDTIYIPNPISYDLKKDAKERLWCQWFGCLSN
ncbi:MAG: hypothetical protein ABJA79_11465, partial [Parafilimonas sp.]